MSSAASALAPAPFPEDQLAEIRRMLAGATAEQRHWLGGYIAGFQAAMEARAAPAPAAPPARKTPLTILYATESGNAEALAAAARKEATRMGFAAKLLDMADTTPEDVARAGNLMVIASTWGEGDPPQRAEAFMRTLMSDKAPRCDELRYSVLALGDRAYARFCETGRRIDERIAELGGRRIAPRIDCDLDYETPARNWIGGALRELAPDTGAAVIHVDFMRPAAAEEGFSRSSPFEAELTALNNLNGSRSSTRTYHVELSLSGSGFAYEPGDSLGFLPANDPELVESILKLAGRSEDGALRTALAERFDITTLTAAQIAAYAALTGEKRLAAMAQDVSQTAVFMRDRQFIDLLEAAPQRLAAEQLIGLLRPLPPRLYSIASSRKQVGEDAHLLVGAVAWQSHGRARKGVASGDIGERRAPGQRMKVYLQPNRHFRLPNDPDRPIVMVGPGTGVAPFRAFMQECEATGTKRRSWLFFGARNFLHDFLYQLEWQDLLKRGVLTRVDVAFSRDQRDKIYVQHRMWEARAELFRWLEDGAHFYVCGDAQRMAKDVQAALERIVADQSGRGAAHAEAYVRELQTSGRYLKDVY